MRRRRDLWRSKYATFSSDSDTDTDTGAFAYAYSDAHSHTDIYGGVQLSSNARRQL
jgi:hypothetical protein